jgi:hypothetical protein
VGGGGASAFTDLTDTPASYTGQSLRLVRVNAAATGLEFFTPTVFASNWAVPFRGALTQKTATQSVAANTETAMTFNSTIYDTDSFWSNANPSRLTVPAGVTRVVVSGNVRVTGGSTSAQLQLRMNGGDVVGVGNVNMSTGFTVAQINAVSAPISVTAGDYFEASVFVTAARTIDSSARTWLAIQVVEVSTAEQAPSISGARGLNAWGGTAGGTANARTVSLTPALTTYFAGLTVRFENGTAANTGAATLGVDGLGAVAIRKGDGSADLDPGDLRRRRWLRSSTTAPSSASPDPRPPRRLPAPPERPGNPARERAGSPIRDVPAGPFVRSERNGGARTTRPVPEAQGRPAAHRSPHARPARRAARRQALAA